MHQDFEFLLYLLNRFKAMKKNLGKMIVEISPGMKKTSRTGFKMTCSNAHEYTNKILVDSEEYNRPSNAQRFIAQEMEQYQVQRQEEIAAFKEKIKRKTEKPITINNLLTQIQRDLSVLAMEEVMNAIKFAKRDDILQFRSKLLKLESSLSFKLEEENLEPHLQEALQSFLRDLNQLINKSTKIY